MKEVVCGLYVIGLYTLGYFCNKVEKFNYSTKIIYSYLKYLFLFYYKNMCLVNEVVYFETTSETAILLSFCICFRALIAYGL